MTERRREAHDAGVGVGVVAQGIGRWGAGCRGCVMAQGGRAGPGVGALDIIFKAIDIFFGYGIQ